LSTNILYRWRFLLRRFVGESPFLPFIGWLLAKHERRCVQKNKKLAYKLFLPYKLSSDVLCM
jgi:hypothetical protein